MSKNIIDYLLSGIIWGLTALSIILGGIFLYRNGYQDGFDDCSRGSTPDIVQTQSLHPADTVSSSYYYSGSNFPILMSLYNKTSNENVFPQVSETVFTDYIPLKFSFGQLFPNSSDNYIRIDYPGSYFSVSISDFINGTFVNWEHFHIVFGNTSFYPNGTLVGSFGIGSDVSGNLANFNFDVRYFIVRVEPGYHGNSSLVRTHINFYDSNGNDISFTFGVTPGNASGQNQLLNSSYVNYVWSVTFPTDYSYSLTSRTYYLSTVLSDNDAYKAGLDFGKTQGEEFGYNRGYGVGYDTGYKIGDGVGYERGVLENHNYTFSGLFGAMFDVPVQIFTSLLNFNLLGVNLFEFGTGILTAAILIRVIGFILGKK